MKEKFEYYLVITVGVTLLGIIGYAFYNLFIR